MSLREVMARTYATVPQEPLVDARTVAQALGLNARPTEIHLLARQKGWPRWELSKQRIRYRLSEVFAVEAQYKSCENQPQPEAGRMQRKETRP